jgi:hypothetical protein
MRHKPKLVTGAQQSENNILVLNVSSCISEINERTKKTHQSTDLHAQCLMIRKNNDTSDVTLNHLS